MNEASLQRLADRAKALADQGLHGDAARAFEELAGRAGPDRLALAGQAWTLASDAWRRDDRPREAVAAGVAAERLAAPVGDRLAVLLAARAGAHLDAGNVAGAREDADRAVAVAGQVGVSTLALDLAAGAAMVAGDIDAARRWVVRLQGVAPPAARPAVAFRLAALKRLDGDLMGADALLAGVEEAAADQPHWAGPAAAASQERGEIALLVGKVEEAGRRFAEAEAYWASAGRAGGAARCRGGRLRAALEVGGRPPLSLLDDDIRRASERGMVLLEAELRLARGRLRAARHVSGAQDDLDQAVSLASGAGARLLEGRARVGRRKAGFRHTDEARIDACLQHDAVWRGWRERG
jgi:hypothetical protein